MSQLVPTNMFSLVIVLFLARNIQTIPLSPSSNGADTRELTGQETVPDQESDLVPEVPSNACFIFGDDYYGPARQGTYELLEDCTTVEPDEIPTLESYYGSVILICCPHPPDAKIYFPIEGGLEDYPVEPIEDFGPLDGAFSDYPIEDDPRSLPNPCPEGGQCLGFTSCSSSTFLDKSPPTSCGWSNGRERQYCCNASTPTDIPLKVGPSSSLECEDRHRFCPIWANEETCNEIHPAFDFLSVTCLQSCQLCPQNMCQDDFAQCHQWALAGLCSIRPDAMLMNCRLSCGLCGRSGQSQLKNGKTYTFPQDKKFYCGGGKESRDEPKDKFIAVSRIGDVTKFNPEAVIFPDFKRKKRSSNDTNTGFFAYTTEKSPGQASFCGSVMVSDEFFVSAAHCYANHRQYDPQLHRTITIREGTQYQESLEVKRLFVHPNFKLPGLHDDIVVGQLGRRVDYDYDKYGDSPNCLPPNEDDFKGLTAFVQGRGRTENFVQSTTLLEANVTIVDNEACFAQLCDRSKDDRLLRRLLIQHLPYGITNDLLCATGFFNAILEKYTSPCHGDSGGPLYIRNEAIGSNRGQTLVGLVSGGLSCGEKTPTWYTRVAEYRTWILCVLKYTKRFDNRQQVQDVCDSIALTPTPKTRMECSLS